MTYHVHKTRDKVILILVNKTFPKKCPLHCLVPPVALTVHTDVFHTYGPFLPHHRIRVVLGKYEAAVVFAGTSERKKVNEMFIKFVGGRNRTCDGS